VESRIGLVGRAKTLQEERRRDQDDHRKSNFRSHQNFCARRLRGAVLEPERSPSCGSSFARWTAGAALKIKPHAIPAISRRRA